MPMQHWFEGEGEWVPQMDHRGGGAESHYRPEIGREILRQIAHGRSVKDIAADPNMPCYATIYRWRRMIPEFGARWRALRLDMAEETIWLHERHAAQRALSLRRKVEWAGGRWWRRGRPSSYTPAVGAAICARLEAGETMVSINADPAMPSAKVVYRWLRTEPAFREQVAAARRHAVGFLAFEADDARFNATPETWAWVRRQMVALEGRAGRITPKVYGRRKDRGGF